MKLTHVIFSWLSFWALLSAHNLAADTQGINAHGLRSGWLKSNGQYTAALEIHLAPGWKTYWRAPGDTGFPPQFDFSGSRNAQELEIIWPAPILFGPQDMWSIGYSGHVVLPLLVQPSDPQSLVELNLKASLGICDDICIPAALSFSGVLSPDSRTPDPKIIAALANLPYSKSEAGLKALACTFSASGDTIEIDVQLSLPPTGDQEIVMIEYSRLGHWVSMQHPKRNGQVLSAKGFLHGDAGRPSDLRGSDVSITVVGSNYTVDAGTCAP
ncbi:MAG: hypothetical protein EVA86_05470 [Rhodobacteraceae bacterium]|nr:MAG: hypothetical protein EVA86_05470 [Paracoccaceae bacterium]